MSLARRLPGPVFAALLTSSIAAPAQQAAPTQQAPAAQAVPAKIDRNGVLILVRSTILALNQANETGNYTVLRDLGASGFRDLNTAARLGDIFASQRAQKLDLSGVAVLEPQLTLMPQIEANGLMRLAGFFPSVPYQVNFELLFAPVDGRWRLFGLAVNLGTSTPTAPSPSPPPADGKASPADNRTQTAAGKVAKPEIKPPRPDVRHKPPPVRNNEVAAPAADPEPQ